MTEKSDHQSEGRAPEVDCSRVLIELYTYLDGELTEERRTRIAGHLDDCSPCLEIFDFEAELRLVIQQRCREEVPEHLRSRIQAALQGLDGTSGGAS